MTDRARRLLVGGAIKVVAVPVAAAIVIGCGGSASESPRGSTQPSPTQGETNAGRPSSSRHIPKAPPRSAAPLYWGAWVENRRTNAQPPWNMSGVDAFQSLVKKKLSLIAFSSPYADCTKSPCIFYDFPTIPMETIRRYGAIPFFSWGLEAVKAPGLDTLDQPAFQLSDVIAGRLDGYIRKFATYAAGWGHPFFLRFNWEMNGDWFPWSEQRNGNQPGQYVKAWRHVHDIFTEVGATNATWVWCPNVDPERDLQEISLLYPGDQYVDWTCLDGYNWGPGNPTVTHKPWRSFARLFQAMYRQVVEQIAPTKPMILGEFATSDYGGDKAAWIRDALVRIPTRYPRIRGLVWFNLEDRQTHWPIETSQTVIDAFRTALDSPVYLGNEFGGLTASPIEPPSRG
jgi:hypothetical protein